MPPESKPQVSDDRPIVYREGDTHVYRASAVGRPLRCLMLARLGWDPKPDPDYLVEAALAGTLAEPVVKARMAEMGYTIGGEQDLVEIPVPGTSAIIRGHLDGWSVVPPEALLADGMLEVKSMSERVHTEWTRHQFERFPEYAAQVTCYHYARFGGGEGLIYYAVLNRDTDDLTVQTFATPPADMTEIFARVQAIEALAVTETLPTCSGAKYQCAYAYQCDARLIEFSEDLSEATEARLAEVCTRIDRLNEMIAAYESEKDALRSEVTEAAAKLEAGERLVVADYSISMTRPKPTKKLDEKALRKKLGTELDKYYTESARNPYVTIRKLGG